MLWIHQIYTFSMLKWSNDRPRLWSKTTEWCEIYRVFSTNHKTYIHPSWTWRPTHNFGELSSKWVKHSWDTETTISRGGGWLPQECMAWQDHMIQLGVRVHGRGIPEWPTGMIASRDYCTLLWGSARSRSHTKCMGMTTVVDKIACRSCTACPPPIVLTLFIADTIGFTTVYR